MKKIFLIYISLISSVLIFGQVTATGTFKSYHKQYNNIDYLFVFNGLTSSSSLKYNGNYTTINWYKFSAPTKSIGNQPENFNVENANGYILEVDDDGAGFDPSTERKATSHGISNMYSRTKNMDGNIELKSNPGGGTRVLAWLPKKNNKKV